MRCASLQRRDIQKSEAAWAAPHACSLKERPVRWPVRRDAKQYMRLALGLRAKPDIGPKPVWHQV